MSTADRRLNRREALVGTGLLGAGALAALLPGCGTSSADAAGSTSTGLEGAWLQAITFDDGRPGVQTLNLYLASGEVVSVSAFPQPLFSPGLGARVRTADNQHQITFEVFGFDPSGQLAGTWRVRSLVRVDQSKDRLTGRGSLEFQSVGQSTFAPAGTYQLSGTRIKALAL